MKKCAICGKEINGGFLVEKECLEKLQAELENKEPTTAEKLLMLTNYCETVSHSRYFRDIYLTMLKDKTNISKGFWYGEDEDYKTITEAIDAAYNWAKEQGK